MTKLTQLTKWAFTLTIVYALKEQFILAQWQCLGNKKKSLSFEKKSSSFCQKTPSFWRKSLICDRKSLIFSQIVGSFSKYSLILHFDNCIRFLCFNIKNADLHISLIIAYLDDYSVIKFLCDFYELLKKHLTFFLKYCIFVSLSIYFHFLIVLFNDNVAFRGINKIKDKQT